MPITVRFDPTVNSLQAQIIPDVTLSSVGLMTPEQLAQLEALVGVIGGVMQVFSDTGVGAPIRPDPSLVGADLTATPPIAVQIWNIDDKAPNFSDGLNWYDSDGNLT